MIIANTTTIMYEITNPQELKRRNKDKEQLKQLGYKLKEESSDLAIAIKTETTYTKIMEAANNPNDNLINVDYFKGGKE